MAFESLSGEEKDGAAPRTAERYLEREANRDQSRRDAFLEIGRISAVVTTRVSQAGTAVDGDAGCGLSFGRSVITRETAREFFLKERDDGTVISVSFPDPNKDQSRLVKSGRDLLFAEAGRNAKSAMVAVAFNSGLDPDDLLVDVQLNGDGAKKWSRMFFLLPASGEPEFTIFFSREGRGRVCTFFRLPVSKTGPAS